MRIFQSEFSFERSAIWDTAKLLIIVDDIVKKKMYLIYYVPVGVSIS